MKIRHTIENESTWEKLKAAVVAGAAGALIQPFNEIDLTLENGEAITVVAAAHLPAAEDKPAGLRFVFKDCLAEPHPMNKTWTNRGGSRASEGRRHLLEDVLPLLPADLRAVIRPRKITEITEGKTLVYEDPLWLPSETDVFGRGHESLQNGVADGPDDFTAHFPDGAGPRKAAGGVRHHALVPPVRPCGRYAHFLPCRLQRQPERQQRVRFLGRGPRL